MNILIVSQCFWPENFRINDLAIGLKDRGHNLTVLTGIPNYPGGSFFDGYGIWSKRKETYQDVTVIRMPLIPRGSGSSFRLALNYISFALAASFLAPFTDLGKYDCIFIFQLSPVTQALPALILSKIHKKPVVMWVQDLWPESLSAVGAVRSTKLLKAVKKLVSFIYNHCDMILVQSTAFIQSVQQHCQRPTAIEYFPNSTEEFYRPLDIEKNAPERNLVPSGFIVMFAGNIGVAQDFPSIIAAAELTRDIPDIKWVVIGDGRQMKWLSAEIARRNLSGTVYILGRYPVEQMPRFFALADALLVTLKRDPIFALTIPSKIQSYMACARPIIAALDGEGARIVAEAGSGLVCPAEDPEALAAAVVSLYSLPRDTRDDMGRCGQEYYVKHFERNMLLDRLEGWINKMVTVKQ